MWIVSCCFACLWVLFWLSLRLWLLCFWATCRFDWFTVCIVFVWFSFVGFVCVLSCCFVWLEWLKLIYYDCSVYACFWDWGVLILILWFVVCRLLGLLYSLLLCLGGVSCMFGFETYVCVFIVWFLSFFACVYLLLLCFGLFVLRVKWFAWVLGWFIDLFRFARCCLIGLLGLFSCSFWFVLLL